MQTQVNAPGRSGAGLSSTVTVPKPGGDMRRNWVGLAQVASALKGQADATQALRGQLAVAKQMGRRLDILHPFKLYQLPDVLRVAQDADTDWRKFIVRAGNVMGVDATGTDGINADPDSEEYPTESAEILVPEAAAKFWFWLELVSGEITEVLVRYGSDPTAESYTPAEGDPTTAWTSTNAWSGVPVPDSAHIPIGWVDTDTFLAERSAVVRQLLRADMVQVGGGGSGTCPEA